MRDLLHPGMTETLAFRVPREKTVPFLYPEAPEFQAMPEVFATGFMIGLMEWCCIRSLSPALDAGEGSLGTAIEVSHVAATPPGALVKVTVTVEQVEGRKVTWRVSAHDGIDLIGEGRIGRAVVDWERFNRRVDQKAAALAALNTGEGSAPGGTAV